jgi:AcrR family transcriptional regulator
MLSKEKIDPRIIRTHQSIERAFLELVSLEGFQAINVQNITSLAGVNRATFYAHFPDKYALLDHTIQHRFREAVEQRMLNACQYSDDNLRALIIVVCEYVADAHSRCAVTEQQYRSLVEAQVRSQVYELINRWYESVPISRDSHVPRERAATAASWVIYGLATEWSRAKRIPPVEQYADEVLTLVAVNLNIVQPA